MHDFAIYDIEGGVHTLQGIVDDVVIDGLWFFKFAGGNRVFTIPVARIDYANAYKVDNETEGETGSVYDKSAEGFLEMADDT